VSTQTTERPNGAEATAAMIHEVIADGDKAREIFDRLRANDPAQAQAVALALAGGAQ
jgi:hypothetical protein